MIKRGCVAICNAGFIGLVTSEHKQMTKYGHEAWIGIHLSPDKAGQDWCSKNPKLLYDSIEDMFSNKWREAFGILAKIMPGIPIDENDPLGTASKIDDAIRQQMTNMSTLIESYARDNRPSNWMHQEICRLGIWRY